MVRLRAISKSYFVLAVLALSLLSSLPTGTLNRAEAAAAKITICHRTHSVTNPYRRITVSQNAVTRNNGHKNHNAAAFDPSYSYPSNAKNWGDIVPDASAGGSNSIKLNFTDRGLAIYNGSTYNGYNYAGLCGTMTAQEFYDVEIAAGVPSADVLADLDEQDANEDYALKQSLGGSFIGASPSALSSVSATTNAATSVTDTTSTLNGVLAVGATSTDVTFEWGTDPDLATYTTTTASPSTVTGNISVTANLTGLTPGTTYYFRVVGTTNAGSDLEGRILGDILSFTTPLNTTTTTAPENTTTTTTVPETTTTLPPTTTTTVPETTTTVPETTTTLPPTTTTVPETTTTTLPPTTTTTAPETTTTPSTVLPYTARVVGTVWIDGNRNGVQDSNEPGMPNTLVRLEPTASVTAQSVTVFVANTASSMETYTDSKGAYAFEKVEPGQWSVKATLKTQYLSATYDSSGNTDWIVPVSVPVNGVARGDFAAAGTASITGDLKNQAGAVVKDGAAEVVWAGPDGVQGTADDVIFPVVIKNGTFSLVGVPEGSYVVKGQASDGRVARDTSLNVVDGENKTGLLVIDTLPETGRNHVSITTMALLLLAFGAALICYRGPSDVLRRYLVQVRMPRK